MQDWRLAFLNASELSARSRSLATLNPPQPRALDGIKVLDLATLYPAPLLAAMLGDYGADVVKVEPPRGDALRNVGTPGPNGISTAWLYAARNKRSVIVDTTTNEGLVRLAQLCATADVIVVNQNDAQLDLMECRPEALLRQHPNAIIVSLTGFGRSGPRASEPGNGSIAEAFAGFAALNGNADGPPTLPSLALGDSLGAISALNGVLAALYWRDACGGTGQIIDATLYEPILVLLGSTFAAWSNDAPAPVRNGSRLSNAAPRNIFRTADNRWLAISGTTDAQVARLLNAIGCSEIELATYKRAADRVGTNADALDLRVSSWIATLPQAAALTALRQHRIPAVAVNTLAEVRDDPHVAARNNLASLIASSTPAESPPIAPTPTPQMSSTPPQFRRTSPKLGEHTAEVLREWLDITEA